MYAETVSIKCAIVRGGTSKGIFLLEEDLPKAKAERDKLILAIFGSPDVRQIDGLGGADVLTSKLAIVGPPTIPDADVDYTFGQVSIDTAFIDYKGNCGNISAAVGPFAIDAGIVKAEEPVTLVRIHMTNSGRMLRAEVPVKDGRAVIDGDYQIDGVPGTGARIAIDWSDSIGAFTGKLMPTGNATDIIATDEGEFEVSLIDAGNPLVFVEAAALGMQGTESPYEIESDKNIMATIEKIRSEAAVIFGLVDDPEKAAEQSPYNPFFAIISSPASYAAINGKQIAAPDTDVVSRLSFMLRMHKTYPITGTVCTAAASMIPGSIVSRIMRRDALNADVLRIGHPGGVIEVEKKCHFDGAELVIDKIAVGRTARKIMEGTVFVQRSRLL
jgi:2-methylaconitate cis-trans-isomerase PrpF